MAYLEILERDLIGPRSRMEAHKARMERMARRVASARQINMLQRSIPVDLPDIGFAHIEAFKPYRSAFARPAGWSDEAWQILIEVCRRSTVTPHDVLSVNRSALLVRPRNEIAHRLWTERAFTKTRIARLLNRDHTTIIYAIRQHAALLEAQAAAQRNSSSYPVAEIRP